MQIIKRLTSRMIPLPYDNIDTDQIIPARFLKVTVKSGLAEGLFSDWRYKADGSLNPDFPLNQPRYQDCRILLAGHNFGCGSSREHAPWALLEWGIQAVIGTSFADIFRNNALKNNLLPVEVDPETHRRMLAVCNLTTANPLDRNSHLHSTAESVCIDLPSQTITMTDGYAASFPIDPFSKTCLLEGLDALGYLLRLEDHISAYETSDRMCPPGGSYP